MTGQLEGSATFGPGEPNQADLNSTASGRIIFIARYKPDGTLAWVKYSEGTLDYNHILGITALNDNSIVVIGLFNNTAIFGQGEQNETTMTSAGNQDMFIARYNPDGTLAWVKSAGDGMDNAFMIGLTALSDNSTVVTGMFSGSCTFGAGEQNETVLTSTGNQDMFIARYTSDGTLAWAKHAGGEN